MHLFDEGCENYSCLFAAQCGSFIFITHRAEMIGTSAEWPERRSARATAQPQSNPQALHKRLKNQEADDGGLDEKENCVELMIAFVSRHRGGNQPSEIKDTAQKVDRP